MIVYRARSPHAAAVAGMREVAALLSRGGCDDRLVKAAVRLQARASARGLYLSVDTLEECANAVWRGRQFLADRLQARAWAHNGAGADFTRVHRYDRAVWRQWMNWRFRDRAILSACAFAPGRVVLPTEGVGDDIPF